MQALFLNSCLVRVSILYIYIYIKKFWLNAYKHNVWMNTFALYAVGSTLFDKGNMFRLHSYIFPEPVFMWQTKCFNTGPA